MSDERKVAFLLGAGVSIPGGAPRTADLTNIVLEGRGASRHSDSSYLPGPPTDPRALNDEFIGRILPLLEWLNNQVRSFALRRGVIANPNYEQIYYAISQVHDSLSEEFENPALAQFTDELARMARPLIVHRDTDVVVPWTLPRLVEEAVHYIHDIVWRTLADKAQDPTHLQCLVEATKDNDVAPLDVATLNHDALIERALAADGIMFEDGFASMTNGWRPWKLDSLAIADRTRILKLHGSIEWFWFIDEDNPDYYPFGAVPDGASYDALNAAGKRMLPLDARPAMLAGTHNKLQQYSMAEVYMAIHCRWYSGLKRTKNLVVSGYSFGDKAINSRIADWINPLKDGRMIVICPSEASVLASARGVIRNQWHEWKTKGKLHPIESRFADTKWVDVKGLLL